MDSRQQFEEWARKMSMDLEYRNIPGVGQFYECPRTLLAFEAWKASRSEIVIDRVSEELYGINSTEIVRCVNDEWCEMLGDQGIT